MSITANETSERELEKIAAKKLWRDLWVGERDMSRSLYWEDVAP